MTGTTTGQTDVLVVDDHALMRAGLSGLIEGAADMRVVGLAADGATTGAGSGSGSSAGTCLLYTSDAADD